MIPNTASALWVQKFRWKRAMIVRVQKPLVKAPPQNPHKPWLAEPRFEGCKNLLFFVPANVRHESRSTIVRDPRCVAAASGPENPR
jgi:hypothetical protein